MFKFLQQYLQKLFAMKDVREDDIMKPLVPLSELCVSVFFDTNQLGERSLERMRTTLILIQSENIKLANNKATEIYSRI